MKLIFHILLILGFLFSCVGKKVSQEDIVILTNANDSILQKNINNKIQLRGYAVELFVGPALEIENGGLIFIDCIDSWPRGFYKSEGESLKLEVTGVLIQGNDLPVFEETSSGDSIVVQHGISVPRGTNLKEASHRYLLKEASWKVIK